MRKRFIGHIGDPDAATARLRQFGVSEMNGKNIAIKAIDVSKRYRIGLKEQRHKNLFTAVVDTIRSPLKNYRQYRSLYDFRDVSPDDVDGQTNDVIWSLKHISFEVPKGEVVGIIGRNGAGKSTLLKILSKITPPTAGEVRLRGRVSSLLEVGTGFHNELTGRENVYLNGTILGMRNREVDRKFDQIVAFSGIEKFLDTPVKRYSSGMRVRLAFAVSAHLEPEILIIDEVLAVGDAEFQKKCLDKMQDVGQAGRTVLFVSHNMRAIARLCERVILLEDGRIARDGPADDVVSQYLSSATGLMSERAWFDPETAPGNDAVRVWGIRTRGEDGEVQRWVDIHKPVALEVEYESLKSNQTLLTCFHLFNDEGVKIFTTGDQNSAGYNRPRPPGRYISRVWIPNDFFNEGVISVTLVIIQELGRRKIHFTMREAIGFQVVESLSGQSGRSDYIDALRKGGIIRPLLKWELEYDSGTERKGAAL
jgi:lipopolysaccharide transport system ATP-binding protein